MWTGAAPRQVAELPVTRPQKGRKSPGNVTRVSACESGSRLSYAEVGAFKERPSDKDLYIHWLPRTAQFSN